MYLRKLTRKKDGKAHSYWALVESYRTERGPRQRTVAYLGEADKAERLGIQQIATGNPPHQADIFDAIEPSWVEVDARRVRTERPREFGGVWLGLELLRRLGLSDFLRDQLPAGRAEVAWADIAKILILARFCQPGSELHIAEHFYTQSALPDLLGVPSEQVYDNRLYRALDQLLPHKDALESFLKERLGRLFAVHYDLLLYDITSTYFEGLCEDNPQAQRGYSRDKRGDCKQVCIGLVVTREGLPLGYELFDGNRTDVTTVQEMVTAMERRYGLADRVWVMDRGMVSQLNLAFLSSRRYIVGTPKSLLKEFAAEIQDSAGWERIREHLEVKYCRRGSEVYIVCRSMERAEKEHAIYRRFMAQMEAGLERLQRACLKGRIKQMGMAERRLGRLQEQNQRVARFYTVRIEQSSDQKVSLHWERNVTYTAWVEKTAGYYILRTNIQEWSAEELWNAYIQLTQAEAAFRIQKSDLRLRPIWHQKTERVAAHILVCFLAYVLWKTLGQMCKQAGLGDEPRQVLAALSNIQMVDVILPTRQGKEIRLRCVTRPEEYQQVLLQRLSLSIPSRLTKNIKM